MTGLLKKIQRSDNVFMLFFYIMNLLAAAAYIYVIWQEGMVGDDTALLAKDSFFIAFYSFAEGIAIMLNVFLIAYMLRQKYIVTMPLLMVYVITQCLIIAMDIVFAYFYGGFWVDGYIFFIFEVVQAAICLRRYCFLKQMTQTADKGEWDHER